MAFAYTNEIGTGTQATGVSAMQNKTPLAGLLIFALGLPFLALFFCGPCQQYERQPDRYIESPYRLPAHERQIDSAPRRDRWA